MAPVGDGAAEGAKYARILDAIFFRRYRPGATEVPFKRGEISRAARDLDIPVPGNIGDVIYSSRYRSGLPASIMETAAPNMEWLIWPAGRSVYQFRQVRFSRVEPNRTLVQVKVPDATPGVIDMYALDDEQTLLSKIRYNRLIDVFTRSVCYSLQTHLRTSIPVRNPFTDRLDSTQVETDELYVGISSNGAHWSIPVEAKTSRDFHNVIQMWQNAQVARSKFPELPIRCIAAQWLDDEVIVLIEVRAHAPEDLAVVNEAHYRLVPPSSLTPQELRNYQHLTYTTTP